MRQSSALKHVRVSLACDPQAKAETGMYEEAAKPGDIRPRSLARGYPRPQTRLQDEKGDECRQHTKH